MWSSCRRRPQPAGADAMFTVGYNVNSYYRIYVSGGNLIGEHPASGDRTQQRFWSWNLGAKLQ